jgi:hypothetical protein
VRLSCTFSANNPLKKTNNPQCPSPTWRRFCESVIADKVMSNDRGLITAKITSAQLDALSTTSKVALPTCAIRTNPDHPSSRTPVRRGAPTARIIPNAFGEQAVLKLGFSALTRAAERSRAVKLTDFERRQLAAARKQLDDQHEAQVGAHIKSSKDGTHPPNYPVKSDLTVHRRANLHA